MAHTHDSPKTKGFWRFIVPDALVLFFDVSGVLFWTYAFLELFVVDTDALIAAALPPNLAWLANLTVVPVLLWLAMWAVVLRSGVILYIMYIVFFPLIVIFWKIPATLWAIGSWNLGIAVFNSTFALFTDVPYRIVTTAVFAAAAVTILAFDNMYLVSAASVVLLLMIVWVYVRAALSAFRSPKVFALYRKIVGFRPKPALNEDEEKVYGPRGVRVVDMPEDRVTTYRDNLQMRLLACQLSYFVADKLQRFQRSQASVVVGIFSVGALLIGTIAVFTLIYVALHRVWPTSIQLDARTGALAYPLMAYTNMLFGDPSPSHLIEWPAYAVGIFQRTLSVALLGIFVSILLNVRFKKHDAELDETVAFMKKNGYDTEVGIIKYYGYRNIDEAIADIVELNAAFAKFIIRIGGSAAAGMERRSPEVRE